MIKKTATKKPADYQQETSSQRILLEEFKALHTDYVNLRGEGVNRVNFFITAMSVAFGGVLVFASNNNIPPTYFKYILLIVSLIMASIGYEIYNFLIQRDIASDRNIRGLGRIRRYFTQLDPDIKDYFINRLDDTPSGYLVYKSSRMRRSLQILEGFLVGLVLAVISTFAPISVYIIGGIGIGSALLTVGLLEVNARAKLNKVIKSAEKDIRFSKEPL